MQAWGESYLSIFTSVLYLLGEVSYAINVYGGFLEQ